jgi:hypothetical protein
MTNNCNNYDNCDNYDTSRQHGRGQRQENEEHALVLGVEAMCLGSNLKRPMMTGIVLDGSSLEDVIAGIGAGTMTMTITMTSVVVIRKVRRSGCERTNQTYQ